MHLDSGDEIKRNSLIAELPELEFISNLISGIVRIPFSLGKIDVKKSPKTSFPLGGWQGGGWNCSKRLEMLRSGNMGSRVFMMD